MSRQKLNAIEREALWIAHEKKCAYTRELIDISSFHVDHILPESLSEKPEEFARLRDVLGLRDKFDLFGFENMLPCKPGVNLQKGSLQFNPASAHFFLNIASSKKPDVLKNIEQIKSRMEKGRAFLLLQQFLDQKKLTIGDVASLLEQHSETPGEVFRLIERMKFIDEAEIAAISKSNIEKLRDRPIRLGRNDHIDGLRFQNDLGEEILVRTCTEYERAISNGFYPDCNVTLKLSVYFEHQCGLLRALESAIMPVKSFIAEPRVGVTDLHLLPYSLFPHNIGDSDPKISASTGISYQDKINDGDLIVSRVKNNALIVEESEGMGQQLIEVVRADFNGDGLEDILLFEYCYATHGTLGYGGIVMITRRAADAPFEVLP